jgi:hydroxyacylglutathione hydrolase
VRLTSDVALVAGGPMTGFGLSADFDAHAYLIDGGDEAALIDCGLGTESGGAALVARIASVEVDPVRVRRLFLTHYHTDHAGGAGRYRAALGLTVAAAADVAPALAGPDRDATQFSAAQALGLFPGGYEYVPCAVDDPLVDGAERQVGRLTIRAIATPGHCAGHVSYLVTGGEQTYLFTGDALFAGGRILLQAIPDCDLGLTLASIRRLSRESFDALLPGHGGIVLQGGAGHVAAAISAIDRLAVPPSLV